MVLRLIPDLTLATVKPNGEVFAGKEMQIDVERVVLREFHDKIHLNHNQWKEEASKDLKRHTSVDEFQVKNQVIHRSSSENMVTHTHTCARACEHTHKRLGMER